ncbi:MAG TPA: UDP-N-acetylmuramoyl-L-alanyl-D-glutamate--2,6-diaminopimelate ligase [Elusimicrobiota bacterium]|nr:UDP-N-acetylmuramoyl-L-alanyl-D-glutamate--2,6-diaminopimelate ligase [Elusimicrobiota bacterium]
MKLARILDGVPHSGGTPDAEIAALVSDSRQAGAGALFIALPGARTDGNRHIKDAAERGAAAVLSELAPPPAPMTLKARGGRALAWIQAPDVFAAMAKAAANFYGDPSAAMTVVGVTGTKGKTTTTYLLESVISACGGRPGVLGTVSHRLGGEVLEKAANTTPFSLELTRLLARMRDGGATHVAMEVSSHALATQRVEEVHFDAAVFTNLQRDHLDFHKTPAEYFEAKARLFELLEKASSPKKRRAAVLNMDDDSYARLARRVPRAVSYGLSAGADYRADELRPGVKGTRFLLRRGERAWPVALKLAGVHNVHNALAAAAAALELGMPPAGVVRGLESLERVPGRLDPVEEGQDFAVLVDYAHTEASLAAVLGHLKGLPHRRLIVVFGCGGDRDPGKRAPMGEAACREADLAVATSDNPRGEDPLEILRAVEEGMRRAGRENYRIVPDRGEAILEALRAARSGDIVLIAGKGHENAQILKDRTVRFDDREVAARALRALGRGGK